VVAGARGPRCHLCGSRNLSISTTRPRVADDLPPADAHHLPPGERELEVASSILFEGWGRGVRRAAVGLDHQALRRPMEVDHQVPDQLVHGRIGSPAASTSSKKRRSSSLRTGGGW
jgi:hypothetical protein